MSQPLQRPVKLLRVGMHPILHQVVTFNGRKLHITLDVVRLLMTNATSVSVYTLVGYFVFNQNLMKYYIRYHELHVF
jgi:hypothetical protein